ncbi:MAG: preprotein translocase subunit SecG [Candidatus Paceibacterota bacterium]
MEATLPYIQIILSVLLIAAILMQRSEAGLGAVFGGGGDDTLHHTRRGFERVLFGATIVLGVLFALSALASFLLR